MARFPGWNHWAQFVLDIILLALWAAAAWSAIPNCTDACSACAELGATVAGSGESFNIKTSWLLCDCYFLGSDYFSYVRRAVDTIADGVLRVVPRDVFDSGSDLVPIERMGTVPARVGLGAFMM